MFRIKKLALLVFIIGLLAPSTLVLAQNGTNCFGDFSVTYCEYCSIWTDNEKAMEDFYYIDYDGYHCTAVLDYTDEGSCGSC